MNEPIKTTEPQQPSTKTTEEQLYQILSSFFGSIANSNDPRVHQGAAQKGLTELRKLRGQTRN